MHISILDQIYRALIRGELPPVDTLYDMLHYSVWPFVAFTAGTVR